MKTLPEDLREAFFSEEVTNVIIKTAKNYGLHVDQYGILGGEVYGIIFGLSHPKDFIINLTNRLGVEKEIAKKIAAIGDKFAVKPSRQGSSVGVGIEGGPSLRRKRQ